MFPALEGLGDRYVVWFASRGGQVSAITFWEGLIAIAGVTLGGTALGK